MPQMPQITQKLTNTVALITGASSGIGAATALALAAEGAAVALLARRAERLATLAEQISAADGTALAIPTDVTDESQARAAVQQTFETWGRVDILVNNAGVMYNSPIDGADTNEWRRMVDLNIMGVLYMTHATLPIMKQQQRGHIVNVSSVAGRLAFANAAVYNATKWGVVGFSEALRQESFGHGIRTTIIEPGLTETELFDHITHTATREAFMKRVQAMQSLRGEDIANAILYAVTQPPHVNVNEILIRPTGQDR